MAIALIIFASAVPVLLLAVVMLVFNIESALRQQRKLTVYKKDAEVTHKMLMTVYRLKLSGTTYVKELAPTYAAIAIYRSKA